MSSKMDGALYVIGWIRQHEIALKNDRLLCLLLSLSLFSSVHISIPFCFPVPFIFCTFALKEIYFSQGSTTSFYFLLEGSFLHFFFWRIPTSHFIPLSLFFFSRWGSSPSGATIFFSWERTFLWKKIRKRLNAFCNKEVLYIYISCPITFIRDSFWDNESYTICRTFKVRLCLLLLKFKFMLFRSLLYRATT